MGKYDNFFSYGYDKSPLKGVKTPKQSIKRPTTLLNVAFFNPILLYHTPLLYYFLPRI